MYLPPEIELYIISSISQQQGVSDTVSPREVVIQGISSFSQKKEVVHGTWYMVHGTSGFTPGLQVVFPLNPLHPRKINPLIW
jgi:hypothetical protein